MGEPAVKLTNSQRLVASETALANALGRLESGRLAAQNARAILAETASGKKLPAGRAGVVVGMLNDVIKSLNDVAWRLQARARASELTLHLKKTGDLSEDEFDGLLRQRRDLRGELSDLSQTELMVMSHEELAKEYFELETRKRVLAEEFNELAEQVILLRKSRLAKMARWMGLAGSTRIERMFEIVAALPPSRK